MAYDDGKAPTMKRPNPWGVNPGHGNYKLGSIGSKIISKPTEQVPGVQAPTAHGGGLFKAKECSPRKGGV